jgi:hypothetical protein
MQLSQFSDCVDRINHFLGRQPDRGAIFFQSLKRGTKGKITVVSGDCCRVKIPRIRALARCVFLLVYLLMVYLGTLPLALVKDLAQVPLHYI